MKTRRVTNRRRHLRKAQKQLRRHATAIRTRPTKKIAFDQSHSPTRPRRAHGKARGVAST